MRQLVINQGKSVTLVDDDDYEWLSLFSWYVTKSGYARTKASINGKLKSITMHRLIMGAQFGEFVDHRNGVRLDNVKANLRFCTSSENNANRICVSSTGYKGVRLTVNPSGDHRWRATLNVPDQGVWSIGTYATPELAAEAWDCAAVSYWGEFARLNFPDNDYSDVVEIARNIIEEDQGDEEERCGKEAPTLEQRRERIRQEVRPPRRA